MVMVVDRGKEKDDVFHPQTLLLTFFSFMLLNQRKVVLIPSSV
jgi:hypothetical protein